MDAREPSDRSAVEIDDFDKIVRHYWPRVFRFVLASVRNAEEAESLTQDCFWKAYKGRCGFRGDSSVNTWLMRIAVNVIKDFGRNRKLQFWRRAPASDAAEISDLLPDRRLSPEASAVLQEQVRAVWKATKMLSPKQQMIFHLRFVEEMDLLEIAQATGMTEGAVKTHLFRAVHAVRQRLKGRL
jgi:RNA polymerase sigma-70 factor (ECF subfamily)